MTKFKLRKRVKMILVLQPKIVSKHDLEIPQSQTADNP